jgi:hypothetical protein
MSPARSRPTGLSVAERFAISDLLTAWNWAVDAGDAAGLATLCDAEMHIDDNGTIHHGIGSFVQAQVALGRGLQRWTDHPRLSRDGDDILVASMAMISVRHSTGGTGLVWSGHTRDRLRRSADGWRFVSRILRPWDGDILERFPKYAPMAAESRP